FLLGTLFLVTKQSKKYEAQSTRPTASGSLLLDDPGVAAVDQLLQTTWTTLSNRRIDLIDHQVFISSSFNRPEDADRLGKVGLLHARQHKRHRGILQIDVVDQQVALGYAILANLHDFRMGAIHAYP